MLDAPRAIFELFAERAHPPPPRLMRRPIVLYRLPSFSDDSRSRCPQCGARVQYRHGIAGAMHPSGARGCTKAFPTLWE